MIAYLEGKVVYSNGTEIILKTSNGVGYKVTSMKAGFEQNELSLFIYHIIKETSQELYGFATIDDRAVFEKLLSVKGVGPKSAFALMSSLGCEKIVNAIKFEDTKTLSSAPGIGKKAASQIILDLSSKLDQLLLNPIISTLKNVNTTPINSVSESVLQACLELGFLRDSVWPVIIELSKTNSELNESQMLTRVLKSIKN